MEESKKCPVCGRVVSGKQKKYCCKDCALKNQNKMRMERRNSNENYRKYQLNYYHTKNHEKASIRSKTRYQAKIGKIRAKDHCEMCGCKDGALQYHHWTYNNQVTVVSVYCIKCHAEVHQLLNQEGE